MVCSIHNHIHSVQDHIHRNGTRDQHQPLGQVQVQLPSSFFPSTHIHIRMACSNHHSKVCCSNHDVQDHIHSSYTRDQHRLQHWDQLQGWAQLRLPFSFFPNIHNLYIRRRVCSIHSVVGHNHRHDSKDQHQHQQQLWVQLLLPSFFFPSIRIHMAYSNRHSMVCIRSVQDHIQSRHTKGQHWPRHLEWPRVQPLLPHPM